MSLRIQEFIRHPYYIPVISFVVMGFIVIIWQIGQNKSHEIEDSTTISQSADTLIPPGYVLVPIQLHNEASVHSILGAYGLVDLFLPKTEGQKSELIAKGVKIIRAPLNPNQFAVLVSEDRSQELVKRSGPFVAVIQNPSAREGQVLQEEKRKSRVSYGY